MSVFFKDSVLSALESSRCCVVVFNFLQNCWWWKLEQCFTERDTRSSSCHDQAVSVSRTCCHGAYEQLDLLGMLKDLQKLVLQPVVCKIFQETGEHIRIQSVELDVCWKNDWNTSTAFSITSITTNINGLSMMGWHHVTWRHTRRFNDLIQQGIVTLCNSGLWSTMNKCNSLA